MNAGAYGGEVADRLEWVEVMSFCGDVARIEAHELPMTYRNGHLPANHFVLRAAFRGTQSNAESILKTMRTYKQLRSQSQPVSGRTGGSTFKNPPGPRKAWELIDNAGCRGLTHGPAQVSEKHCNFLINRGGATAHQIERLGETVRQRVFEHSGVELEWEIVRIGNHDNTWAVDAKE